MATATDCHRPLEFENTNVLHQLRCGGVLEAVRISCAGFPTKMPFLDFVDHFWNLVPHLLSQPELDDAALARAIAKKAGLTGYQAGHTKVRGCLVQWFGWVSTETYAGSRGAMSHAKDVNHAMGMWIWQALSWS